MLTTYRTVAPPPGRCGEPIADPDRERRIEMLEAEARRLGLQSTPKPSTGKVLARYEASRGDELITGTAPELAERIGCNRTNIHQACQSGRPMRSGWSIRRIS